MADLASEMSTYCVYSSYLNRIGLNEAEPVGMLCLDLEDVAGIVLVHRERRDQHRTIDTDRIHCRDHLIAGHLVRPDQDTSPRPFRAVAFIAVHLGVDGLPFGSASAATPRRMPGRIGDDPASIFPLGPGFSGDRLAKDCAR